MATVLGHVDFELREVTFVHAVYVDKEGNKVRLPLRYFTPGKRPPQFLELQLIDLKGETDG